MLHLGECGPLLHQIKTGGPQGSWADLPPDLIYLYTAAAEACLSQWDKAQPVFDLLVLPLNCHFDKDLQSANSFLDRPDGPDECVAARMQVYRWTEGLLKAHQADPNFTPNFNPPPKPEP